MAAPNETQQVLAKLLRALEQLSSGFESAQASCPSSLCAVLSMPRSMAHVDARISSQAASSISST